MSPLIAVFLGIIALCALIQAAVFAALAVASWKAAGRVETLADRAETELLGLGRKIEDMTIKVETLSRKAEEAMARTEPLVDKVADRTERAGAAVRRAAEIPFVPFKNGSALLSGMLRAFEVYRQVRGPAAR